MFLRAFINMSATCLLIMCSDYDISSNSHTHRMAIIICFLCSVTVENIVICMWCLDTHPVNSLLEHSYFWGMAWIKWDHTGERSIVCGQWGCLYLYVIMGPRSIYIHLFLIMYHFLYYCHAPLPKIRGTESGRESATHLRKKNTSRIRAKPKVTWTSYKKIY